MNESLWRSIPVPRFPRQKLPRDVDVVIIGAGITGLTAAYLLKRSGKRVAVFDREHVGAGETGNTSAHLTYVTDLRLTELVQRFGKDAATLVWRGGATAIDLIETRVKELGITCGFQRIPGFLYASLHGSNDESQELQTEAALARELGFSARFLADGPILEKPAVSYADQALFHPLQYLAALARAVDGDGSFVCDACEVGEVLNDPTVVIVNGETIACDYVIIATHVPMTGATGIVSSTLFRRSCILTRHMCLARASRRIHSLQGSIPIRPTRTIISVSTEKGIIYMRCSEAKITRRAKSKIRLPVLLDSTRRYTRLYPMPLSSGVGLDRFSRPAMGCHSWERRRNTNLSALATRATGSPSGRSLELWRMTRLCRTRIHGKRSSIRTAKNCWTD
jgi:hypothetical protein